MRVEVPVSTDRHPVGISIKDGVGKSPPSMLAGRTLMFASLGDRNGRMITGPQLLAARLSTAWAPAELARRAKVPLSVVTRAESSPDEPMVTIAHLNALMQVLRTAGASFPPPASETETAPSGKSAPSQAPIDDV